MKIKDPLAQEGYDAYQECAEITENPYDEGTDGYESWRRGWKTANIEFAFKHKGDL